MAATTAAKNRSSTLLIYPPEPLEIDFGNLLKPMDDENFFYFCQRHRDLRIEMDRSAEITTMAPAYSETGRIHFKLNVEFGVWAKADGTDEGFDSSTGFSLPNGAKRSPDLSWIRREKWLAIPAEKPKKFAPLCPEFVVELRSESDPLAKLQAKTAEYVENGAELGWLIDVNDKKFTFTGKIPPLKFWKTHPKLPANPC